MVRRGRTDLGRYGEPLGEDDEGDAPSRAGDVAAVALGVLIGLLLFLALLYAFWYEVGKAFGSENAAGDAPVSWYQA